jgi:hypothetical protein
MQKLIFLLAVITSFMSCKKTHNSSSPTPSIVGKWSISTVTVIPFDSTGNAINNGNVYTEPSYYYFQFNANNTWTENLSPDISSGIEESGSYVLHSDTSFTLINTNTPTKSVECRIDTLTNTSFVFSHRRSTLFNGITPGFLEYIFHLKN